MQTQGVVSHVTRNSLRIGIDVGGTFTDGVLLDGLRTWSTKTPSTHDDVGIGIVEACRILAEQRGESIGDLLSEVTHFGLGTTVVTNVITCLDPLTGHALQSEIVPTGEGRSFGATPDRWVRE